MEYDINYFRNRQQILATANKSRNDMFDAMDQIDHGLWEAPEEFADIAWVDELVTTEGHDVLAAGVRIVSDPDPKFTVLPRSLKGSDEDKADAYERGLKSVYLKANYRREGTVIADAGRSALKYGEVAIHVMYVPEQIAGLEEIGEDGQANRYKAIQRMGKFVYTVHNARNVNARHSDFGLEEICLSKVIDPQEVVDLFPNSTQNLQAALENVPEGHVMNEVTLHNYYNYNKRAVWIDWTSADDMHTVESDTILITDWKYPFLPWAYGIVGTSIEHDAEHKRRPLLYTAHHFGLYDLLCRVRSLRYSELFRFAGTSRRAFIGEGDVDIDQDPASPDMALDINADPSEFMVKDLSPPMPDPSMAVLHGELRQDLETSTLSKILMGAQPPATTAFATVNLVTHSALAVITPFVECTEKVMGQMAEISLLWLHYSDAADDITIEGIADEDMGQEFTLRGDDVDPDNLMVLCSISADVPTDKQANALTAINLMERGLWSKRKAMDETGVTDAAKMEEEIWEERMDQAEAELWIKNRMTLNDVALQQRMMQQAMMMLMQQAQQNAGAPVEEGGRSLMGPRPTPRQDIGQRGTPVEGELANPAAGGASFAQFSPNMTREALTDRTRSGEESVI